MYQNNFTISSSILFCLSIAFIAMLRCVSHAPVIRRFLEVISRDKKKKQQTKSYFCVTRKGHFLAPFEFFSDDKDEDDETFDDFIIFIVLS